MTEKATPVRRTAGRRGRLDRDRILRAALRLADEHGIEGVSMRRIAQALHVEAMSLYKHVADKEDILDGLADHVMGEVELPAPDMEWPAWLRQTAILVHAALLRHPWAPVVLESRFTPGPARLRYLDSVVGVLRRAGFSLPEVAQSYMALDSHIYGFTLQETSPTVTTPDPTGAAVGIADRAGDAYPDLRDIALAASSDPGAFPVRFEFGLDILLDGLVRMRAGGGSR